jgi:hypothetical protein
VRRRCCPPSTSRGNDLRAVRVLLYRRQRVRPSERRARAILDVTELDPPAVVERAIARVAERTSRQGFSTLSERQLRRLPPMLQATYHQALAG